MKVPAVAITRDTHTVVAAGENVPRLDHEVEADLYGNPWVRRSTVDSILGEQDSWVTLSWDGEMAREPPFSDDRFPMSMPQTIANVGFRASETDDSTADSPEVENIEMTHLYVQDEARGAGYGLLMWDLYLAAVAYAEVPAAGGVGSTGGGGTTAFLKRQGVPESDISPGAQHPDPDGGRLTRWYTQPKNVLRPAPITRQEVSISR